MERNRSPIVHAIPDAGVVPLVYRRVGTQALPRLEVLFVDPAGETSNALYRLVQQEGAVGVYRLTVE